MKKISKTLILLLTAVFLSSCSGNSPSTSSSSEKPGLEKTKLEHNIKEYINNNVYSFSSSPYEGEVKTLVIPIWFTDSSSYIDEDGKTNIISDLNSVFNSNDQDLGWYSVSSFYKQESMNKFRLSAVVSDWCEINKAHTYFASGYSGVTNLSIQATNWYFSTTSASRKDFDADEDGYLDSVVLIYGCPNYASLRDSSASNLWAYTSWTLDESQKSRSIPGVNVYMWASYDFMYGSEIAKERVGTSYGYGDTRYCTLDSHTYTHEFGHVLGLEDYYDYSDYGYTAAGGFSMQDYAIGGHDPFSTLTWEWSDVYVPKESTTITINDFQSSHDLILLSDHEVTSVFDEYILLEFYTPTKLNELDSKYRYGLRYQQGPTRPGLRVWHVDARLIYLTKSTSIDPSNITTNPDEPKARYGVYLMESNSYGGDNASPLGSKYYNYNILQLIRNDFAETYKPIDQVTNNELFKNGSTFDISTYSKQFVKGTRLNNGGSFDWTFKVTSMNDNQATIELTLN